MYCLRLFIVFFYKNYIVYYCYYCGAFIEKHVYTLDWILCTWPYRNVWPEAIYCCFTRTTLFNKLFTCFYDQS